MNWVNDFKNIKSYYDLYPVLIWSLVPNRKRYYIHFIDKLGNKVLFVKLTSCKNDYYLLKNEYKQLVKIQNKNNSIKKFNTPKVIDYGEGKEYCHLVVKSLEKDDILFHPSKNNLPVELIKEIQGTVKQINLKKIYKLKWWMQFELSKDKVIDLFQFIKNSNSNTIVKVSFVHGDFKGKYFNKQKGAFKVIIGKEQQNVAHLFRYCLLVRTKL